MNPTFGSSIREQIFEQITQGTIQNIEDIIKFGINDYFPQVQINNLSVKTSPDQNIIQVYFSYSINNTNIQDEILINFNNG
jgi:phage baseplate assembly protein W